MIGLQTTIALYCGAALITAAPGIAQPSVDCRSIEDPKERLSCFDAAGKDDTPKVAKGNPAIAKAQAVIRQRLLDPASARFESVRTYPGAVCGFVNAKNRMGGYSGRAPFVYLIKENTGWVLQVPMPPVESDRALAAIARHCPKHPGF